MGRNTTGSGLPEPGRYKPQTTSIYALLLRCGHRLLHLRLTILVHRSMVTRGCTLTTRFTTSSCGAGAAVARADRAPRRRGLAVLGPSWGDEASCVVQHAEVSLEVHLQPPALAQRYLPVPRALPLSPLCQFRVFTISATETRCRM
eukprot:scaffold74539_cov31-Tisochrysis_lutea.AAC.1